MSSHASLLYEMPYFACEVHPAGLVRVRRGRRSAPFGGKLRLGEDVFVVVRPEGVEAGVGRGFLVVAVQPRILRVERIAAFAAATADGIGA